MDCSFTLRVSKGWPTKTKHMPPKPPDRKLDIEALKGANTRRRVLRSDKKA